MAPEYRACRTTTHHEPVVESDIVTRDTSRQASAGNAFPDDRGLQERFASPRRGWGEFKRRSSRTSLNAFILQFPLVHRSELVLHKIIPTSGGWWENLAESSINGRPVLIKRYQGREGKKV